MQRRWQTDWAVQVSAAFVQTDLDSVIVGLVGRTAKAEVSAELVGQKVKDPTVLLARKETSQTVLSGRMAMHRIVPLEQKERH